jgi:hypothetical protein
MPFPYSASRCSLGAPLMFRWYGDVAVVGRDHLLAATQSFLRAVDSPLRQFDPYSTASLVAEFQDRLVQGIRGNLSGTKKVKTVALFPGLPLFEIRWNSMTVLEQDPSGKLISIRIAVRLYHSEPAELQGCFVGHLIHEKKPGSENQVREDQNRQISLAAQYFRQGRASLWNRLDTDDHPI